MKRIFLTLLMIAAGIHWAAAQSCTITLTSAAGTDDQAVCINTPITDIVYSTTGTSNVSVPSSLLPAGVLGSFDANTGRFTISGTPSQSGTFNYTVILAGCQDVVATGKIIVTPTTAITLTSATGTDDQALCFNTAIEDITYSAVGATGADCSGLPTGVTGEWKNNTFTISGVPLQSGIFNYIVIATGCGTTTKTGTITVLPEFKFTTQPHNGETICYDNMPAPLEVAVTGGSAPYHYFWQESSTGTDPWKNATNGEDNPTYQPPQLKETTFYRCNVTSDANCGTISSNNTEITVQEAPSVEFTKSPPGPACANQQGMVYAVELLDNTTYNWSVEHGTITEDIAENEKMIKWDKVTTPTTGVISIELQNTTSGCTFTKQQNVAISTDVAPDANDIVVKHDKNGEPYMLIYPNPSGTFHYQWYKNDMTIDEATEQFYYPPNFNQILEKETSYKVYIAEQSSASCGNFSKELIITGEYSLPKNTAYFSVVPNPNRGVFSIVLNKELIENQQSEMLLQITTLSGEMVWERKIKGVDDVFINQTLSAGSYIVTLTTSDRRIFSQTIIVQ